MNPELASALSSHVVPAFQGNNVVQMASSGSDKNLTARFFLEPVYQEFQSQQEGRAVYKDEAFVHICAPGAKTDIIKKVQMEDRMDVPSDPHRFPRQWQQFCDQQTQVPDGTPLEMCAFLPKHRVMELKAVKIFTAEHYAELPDSAGQTLGMGWQRERELCRAYLNEDSKVQALSKAMSENAAMAADIAALRQQVAALAGGNQNAAFNQANNPFVGQDLSVVGMNQANQGLQQPAKRKYQRRAAQGE